jgi:hypothetical protein
VRSAVQGAYDAAQAKPLDADANRRLGMFLHSFEQVEPAEICSRRVHKLDPNHFQWLVSARLEDSWQVAEAEEQ